MIEIYVERRECPIDSTVSVSDESEVMTAESRGRTTATIENSLPNGDDMAISSHFPSAGKKVEATEVNSNMEPIQDSNGDGVPGHFAMTSYGNHISLATHVILDGMLSADDNDYNIPEFLDRRRSKFS
jgi:hypothetical protein